MVTIERVEETRLDASVARSHVSKKQDATRCDATMVSSDDDDKGRTYEGAGGALPARWLAVPGRPARGAEEVEKSGDHWKAGMAAGSGQERVRKEEWRERNWRGAGRVYILRASSLASPAAQRDQLVWRAATGA